MEKNKRRDTSEYKNWRVEVLKRDKYTCKCCGKKSDKTLVVHHIDGYDWCIERRYDVDNGITLCEECHKLFHHFYGYGLNTKSEFDMFMSVYSKINNYDDIQENDLYKDSIESRKLKLDKLRNYVKSSHSKFVHEVDGYEYINSYFENDILIRPKSNLKNSNYKVKSRADLTKKYNIQKVKSRTVYIKVKHLLCGSIYAVQASQFKTQNKRCGKCCGTYEKSLEYYVKNKYSADISDYYLPEDNNGIKASTISPKSSTKKYIFRCAKNSKHKKYKCTPESFINSYDYSRGCKECQKEISNNNISKLHENNIVYSEDYIKELIEKSSKNSQLEIIEEIDSDGKKRYVQLCCKKHKHSIIPKMSVTIFNNKVNEKILCSECELEQTRENIYKELIDNGFKPYDGEMEKWENIKSRVRCKEKDGYDGYIVNITVEYLRMNNYESRNIIFNQPIKYKNDLTYNIALLCEKVGLKFNGEYDNSLDEYIAIKYDKYKVSFRISDIRDIIDNNKDYETEIKNRFNEFHKNNIYKMENLNIFLQENNINLISKDIDYIDGRRFVDISFYKDINIEDKTRKIEFKATLSLNDYLCKNNLPSISHYSNKKFLIENMQKIIDAKGMDYELLDTIEVRDSEDKLRIKFSAYKGKNEKIYKVTIDRDSIIDKRIKEPKVFDKSNIFVNKNIDKYCEIYRPQYRRISEYENAKAIMEWEDIYNNKIVPMSWSNFSRKK